MSGPASVLIVGVAGFAKARGGALLIGVADDGTICGIEDDYRLVNEASRDKYELWLRDLLTTTPGAPAANAVAVEFDRIEDRDICLVRVPPAPRPVFMRPPKQRMSQFVARVGNSTREFDPAELLSYANGRWSRRILGRPVRHLRPLPETAS